ncbi:MAG TPA: potassium channel family protein, partial [Ktedonobacteraceae bacterium]|nr:potassium channel family protein [Ktedonobacteraceae bacterium]
MKQQASIRHLWIAISLVLGVLVLGIAGYMLIEHFSFIDALFTTVDMMSTVGITAHPLSDYGRLFTIMIIILGVGSLFYTFGVIMEFIIEGHFSQAIGRRIMDRKISTLRNHCIICGFGRVGSRIADEFAAARKSFVVIDENEVTVQRCIQKGYLALLGNAASDDILREAGIRNAQALLAATDQDANNIYISLSARNLNPNVLIVARANNDETVVKLKQAGADRVLSPYAIGGHRMANLALQPNVVDFFDTLINAGNPGLAIQEVILTARSPLIGKSIADAQNILTDGTVILAVKKPGGLVMGSRLETCIESGDA